MNKKTRGEFDIFVLLIVVLSSASSALAEEYPHFIGYVNDYAHLLSASQNSKLDQDLHDLDNRTTIEVAVVTMNSIGGENPGDYAVNLGNLWGVGKQGKDNGIILLVAMDSHDVWIEVGPGLAGQLSSRQVQEIVDDVIIPRFRAGNADQGIIEGSEAIIHHFDRSGLASPAAKASPSAPSPSAPSSQSGSTGDHKFLWIAAVALGLLIVLPGAFLYIVNPRRIQSKKNKAQLIEIRKGLDEMVEKATSALKALKELKASYNPSIWKGVEEDFNSVDLNEMELEFLGAKKISDKGWIQAPAAQKIISELQKSYEIALKNINPPVEKLAEIKKAQGEFQAGLAGLDAAFKQAEHEVAGATISMTTMMELEKAKQLYSESKAMAKQPADMIDWIMLRDRIHMAEEAVEQVSKDAVRDRAIAEEIQGQDPEEMLAKMKETLEAAEKSLGDSYAAKPDLQAGRADYERAQEYRSGRINTIDLYLHMMSVNKNVEHGYQDHQREMVNRRGMELARLREAERSRQNAASAGNTGFWSSVWEIFGGGRMGGGSSGGGYTGGGGRGGGRMGGGSHGGGRTGGSSRGGGRMGGGSRGGGKW